MGPANLVLWALGVAFIALGYLRARDPWRRYQALRQQQANVARYEAWRGGHRGRGGEEGESGADVAMAVQLRQVQIGAALAIVGFVVVFAGFAIR